MCMRGVTSVYHNENRNPDLKCDRARGIRWREHQRGVRRFESRADFLFDVAGRLARNEFRLNAQMRTQLEAQIRWQNGGIR